ncbi:hypothetical protein HDV00_011121 [Rhizophlyctis rosea]|nr:hypothetical protein HDV00_011121 [Rhizophlyctis rosea]
MNTLSSKENTVLRASLDPLDVSVIPNAIVADDFKPNPSASDPTKITIVITSRLVYRKGTDLLVSVIPRVCDIHPDVQFIIAGDGPKRVELEQMRERYVLQERVQLLGAVDHADVPNVGKMLIQQFISLLHAHSMAVHLNNQVLVQGQIFMNTSLTEAFCIAIVEAACCGLLVVSTKVGGVPEVLPEDMIIFAQPEELDLFNSIHMAITRVRNQPIDHWDFHHRVKSMYSWKDVAERNVNHDLASAGDTVGGTHAEVSI